MKFMKLGSKPDSFQTDGNDVRYGAAEVATDIIINVRDVKFYLHKFPLLSKSARLQKLTSVPSEENNAEIHIGDIPGGSVAFELCAKFCYGMKVTLNAYNVVAARCAAEYLEMHESVEKGNLVYKIDVFLNASILRSWKDSIIVLQTTRSLLPWSEDLKVVSHCIDSIASNASIDPSKVEWSYTYNRKKLPSENGIEPQWNGVKKQQAVPKDWWVEDLCELDIDFFKRAILAIKTKGRVSNDIIGEALKSYALKKLPSFSKGLVQANDLLKYKSLVETIVLLLPIESGSVPCSFLLKLLKAAILLDCGEIGKKQLVRRIGRQLEEAIVADLLIPAPAGEIMLYDVDVIQSIVEEFAMQEQGIISDKPMSEEELQEIRSPTFISDTSKLAVAKLVDGYLAEISKDRNLPLSKFVALAESVSGFPRPVHDRLYRAIDTYLKEHPALSKSERKKICRLMNCKKLSVDASMHAVQNEQLPLRVVVQVLFFEQIRASKAPNTAVKPDLPGNLRTLLPRENGGSHGSSRTSMTNTEEDWDSVPAIEELKVLKGELASLKLGSRRSLKTDDKSRKSLETAAAAKVQGILATKKIFAKLWSSKSGQDDSSTDDTSVSPGSTNKEEAKSTPSGNRRYSVS